MTSKPGTTASASRTGAVMSWGERSLSSAGTMDTWIEAELTPPASVPELTVA